MLLKLSVLTMIFNNWWCKDAIDDIVLQENPYNESISWSCHYNANKYNPFNGAFNDVSFAFDKEVDGQTYGVVTT